MTQDGHGWTGTVTTRARTGRDLSGVVLTVSIGIGVFAVGRRITLPPSHAAPVRVLPLFGHRQIVVPWLHIVHAVLVEFPVGIWAVVYLKEVGGASSGVAASLGAIWGLCLFVVRIRLASVVAVFGSWTRSVGFATVFVGTLVMWAGPGLWVRVIGLTIVAVGASALYPLAVDGLYEHGAADNVTLRFVTALASGVGVTIGPLFLGVLADSVGLRHALLFVPIVAAVGVFAARPTADRQGELVGELVTSAS